MAAILCIALRTQYPVSAMNEHMILHHAVGVPDVRGESGASSCYFRRAALVIIAGVPGRQIYDKGLFH